MLDKIMNFKTKLIQHVDRIRKKLLIVCEAVFTATVRLYRPLSLHLHVLFQLV
jgi:hypothetical protein